MEKFNEAKAKEHATMIRARQIALNPESGYEKSVMWNIRATATRLFFYYIADERVDFRQLIKVLPKLSVSALK